MQVSQAAEHPHSEEVFIWVSYIVMVVESKGLARHLACPGLVLTDTLKSHLPMVEVTFAVLKESLHGM